MGGSMAISDGRLGPLLVEQSMRERRFFELSLWQQRESIAKGLATKWSEHLLSLARKNSTPSS